MPHHQGEEIETTPWHPFYTDEGWEDAGDLEPGDLFFAPLGGLSGVVGSEALGARYPVFFDNWKKNQGSVV